MIASEILESYPTPALARADGFCTDGLPETARDLRGFTVRTAVAQALASERMAKREADFEARLAGARDNGPCIEGCRVLTSAGWP